MPEQPVVLAALILERPLCLSCIAKKTGTVSASALETMLEHIRRVLTIDRQRGRCRACGLATMVMSVERPD
jgi:hypothetical protein